MADYPELRNYFLNDNSIYNLTRLGFTEDALQTAETICREGRAMNRPPRTVIRDVCTALGVPFDERSTVRYRNEADPRNEIAADGILPPLTQAQMEGVLKAYDDPNAHTKAHAAARTEARLTGSSALATELDRQIDANKKLESELGQTREECRLLREAARHREEAFQDCQHVAHIAEDRNRLYEARITALQQENVGHAQARLQQAAVITASHEQVDTLKRDLAASQAHLKRCQDDRERLFQALSGKDPVTAIAIASGGTIEERLPHGSAVVSMPLPADHWIYDRTAQAYAAMTVTAAIRSGIREATRYGQIVDFDPDALVINIRRALGARENFGRHTTDNDAAVLGTVRTEASEAPSPIPAPELGPELRKQAEASLRVEQEMAGIPPLFRPEHADTARVVKLLLDIRDLLKAREGR